MRGSSDVLLLVFHNDIYGMSLIILFKLFSGSLWELNDSKLNGLCYLIEFLYYLTFFIIITLLVVKTL